MYGKHYESMYDGSMYGAGCAVFAVWGYVISHARKGVVELNTRKLADTLGATVDEVTKAIGFLEAPDPRSRCKQNGGRRLIKEGEFQYRVPSWETYAELKNEDARREYNRLKQAEYRARKRAGSGVSGRYLERENRFVEADGAGDTQASDRVASEGLPSSDAGARTLETPTRSQSGNRSGEHALSQEPEGAPLCDPCSHSPGALTEAQEIARRCREQLAEGRG